MNLPIFSKSHYENIYLHQQQLQFNEFNAFLHSMMQCIIDYLSETENYFPDILPLGLGLVPADVVWMTPTSKSSKVVMDSGVARAPRMLAQWKNLIHGVLL